MNMKQIFKVAGPLLAAAVFLVGAGDNCGNKDAKALKLCAQHDGAANKKACEEQKNESEELACQFFDADNKCKPKTLGGVSWNGQCDTVKDKDVCDNNALNCKWNATDSKCEKEVPVAHHKLTFGEKVEAAAAPAIPDDISAIGKSGDDANLYFGSAGNGGHIFALTLAGKVNNDRNANAAGAHPGNRQISNAAQVSQIVAGPNGTAIAAVTGVNPADRGLIRLNGNNFDARWVTSNADLALGNDDHAVSALTVIHDNFVAFVDNGGANGTHLAMTTAIAGPPAGTPGIAGPRENGALALGQVYTSALGVGNDLFMAVSAGANAGKVYKKAYADAPALVVAPATAIADDANAPVKPADLIMNGGPANNLINSLALVDGNKLLIGLNDTGVANTGGVAILDIAANTVTKPVVAHSQFGVRHIGVNANKKKAVISTNKGLIVYIDGTFVEVTPSSAIALNKGPATAAKPLALDKYDNAVAKGFDVTRSVGAVFTGDDTVYIGTNNAGIHRFEIAE